MGDLVHKERPDDFKGVLDASTQNDYKITQNHRKELFCENGHVTNSRNGMPPKKEGSALQQGEPPARSPHFQDMRK